MIVVVFSKDRALQLGGTLRSLLRHAQDVRKVEICILYATSDARHEAQYERLREELSHDGRFRFVREQEFRRDLLALMAPFRHVLFLVDDNLFVRPIDFDMITATLDADEEALGFSLRLGENTSYCYMMDAAQRIPEMTQVSVNARRFRWVGADYDFGYPLELSSSIYRVKDVFPYISALDFRNPNTLEAEMDRRKGEFASRRPYLLSFERSAAFCLPLNKVQDVALANRAIGDPEVGVDELARLFDEGWRVNVEYYDDFVPRGCHDEVDFDLARSIDSEESDGARHEEVQRSSGPRVSVVIPCYNQAHYLPDAVGSVVEQTMQEWELIIVNDGSSDETAAVAAALVTAHSERAIRVIDQANAGLAEARNAGVAAARGAYILPLDADDMLDPEMLEKCCEILESDPSVSIVYTDRADFGAAQRIVRAAEFDFETLLRSNHLSYCSLYRRELWEEVGGYNPNMIWGYEDWDFWISCGERGYIARRLPQALFRYRVRSESMYTQALGRHRELMARIILNHPTLYSQVEVMEARRIWKEATNQSDARVVEASNAVWPTSAGSAAGDNPLVSVIIPTYNRPEMLETALKSVCAQSYGHLEIIVVNDAGCDVQHIVDRAADKRIRYLQQRTNEGLAAARNFGIREARGTYVALLDDDDIFYPKHIETALEHLGPEAPVVYTNAVRATMERRGAGYRLVEKRVPYSIDFDRKRLLFGNISPVNCFVFDRRLALRAGLFDPSFTVMEDWEFWLRLSEIVSFKHIPLSTVQVNWRTDGTSMTAQRRADFNRNGSRIEQMYQAERAAVPRPEADAIRRDFRAIWSKDGKAQIPLVSILILTHNALPFTRRCIDSVQRHTTVPHEIIFVDNGSTDGTVEYLRDLTQRRDNYRLIENADNVGFARGNNQAIAAARGAYVLLLNNDVIVTEGWLDRLIDAAESDPSIGIVGPTTNSTSGPQALTDVGYDIRSLDGLQEFAARRAHGQAGARTAFWRAVGFCMLVRREVIDAIGGLDSRFGRGNFEDDDFCVRAAIAGFRTVIARDVFVHHFGGSTFKANRMDHQQSLFTNWEIFRTKWGIPESVTYWERLAHDMTPLLRQPFDEEVHRCSLSAPTTAEPSAAQPPAQQKPEFQPFAPQTYESPSLEPHSAELQKPAPPAHALQSFTYDPHAPAPHSEFRSSATSAPNASEAPAASRSESERQLQHLADFAASVERDDWYEAGVHAAAAARHKPVDPFAWVMVAITHRMRGDLAQALAALETSLSIEETAYAVHELAQVAFEQGDVDRANILTGFAMERLRTDLVLTAENRARHVRPSRSGAPAELTTPIGAKQAPKSVRETPQPSPLQDVGDGSASPLPPMYRPGALRGIVEAIERTHGVGG